MKVRYLGDALKLDLRRSGLSIVRVGDVLTISRPDLNRLEADMSVRFEILDADGEPAEATERDAGDAAPEEAPAEPARRRPGRPRRNR